MAEVREETVEKLESHSTARFDDFVRLIEEDHFDGEPGVDPETVAAYADAVHFDVDPSAIDERLADSDEWKPGERLYEVGDGRVSVYPPTWHEAFDDLDDIPELVGIIEKEVTEPEGTQREAVTDEGVPETKLFRVARVTAGLDKETVNDRLGELSDEGEIQWDTMVHDPRVRLPDEDR